MVNSMRLVTPSPKFSLNQHALNYSCPRVSQHGMPNTKRNFILWLKTAFSYLICEALTRLIQ